MNRSDSSKTCALPNWINESMAKFCYLGLRNSGKPVSFHLLCSIKVKPLKTRLVGQKTQQQTRFNLTFPLINRL